MQTPPLCKACKGCGECRLRKEKCSEEERLVLDRVEREMVREKGQRTASYPEVLPEAFSGLLRYEKLLLSRLIESDMIIEDSPRQESSSHEASPPRSSVPEVPTSADTRGESPGGAQPGGPGGGGAGDKAEGGAAGGETRTELLQLEAEISPLKGKLKEVQESRKEREAARQEMEQSAKRFGPLEAGNSWPGETKEKPGERARERSLILQLESDLQHGEAALRQRQAGARKRQEREHSAERFDPLEAGNSRQVKMKEKQGERAREKSLVLQLEPNLQHREAALRKRQAGARKRQDRAANVGRESRDKELQGVFLDPSLLTENLHLKADRDSSMRERKLMQGRIPSWQQELGKERGVLEDEGLCTERRLLKEQEKPRLKPSRTVRPRAGRRSCTPRPQGGLQRAAGNHFDPHAAGGTEERGHPAWEGAGR